MIDPTFIRRQTKRSRRTHCSTSGIQRGEESADDAEEIEKKIQEKIKTKNNFEMAPTSIQMNLNKDLGKENAKLTRKNAELMEQMADMNSEYQGLLRTKKGIEES
jgi:hypothetical protein